MPLVSKHCCHNGPASLCTHTHTGSFHSDDVEVLIRQDAATYTPPALPFPDPAEQRPVQEACSSCWGANARSQVQIDFGSWSFINHGAFGGASRCGCLVLQQMRVYTSPSIASMCILGVGLCTLQGSERECPAVARTL